MRLSQFKETFKEALQSLNQLLGTNPSVKDRMAAVNAERANRPRQIKKNQNKQAAIAIAAQQQQEQAQEQEQDQEQQQAVKQKKIEDWQKRKKARPPLPKKSIHWTYTREQLEDTQWRSEQHLLWDKCLGKNVKQIENDRNRIDEISRDAWEIIREKENRHFFTDGISLDHPPAGFILYQDKDKVILDYDKKLLNTQEDYPLRVKLNPPPVPPKMTDTTTNAGKPVFNPPLPAQYQGLMESLDNDSLTVLASIQQNADKEAFLLFVHTLNQLKNSGRCTDTINMLKAINPRWLTSYDSTTIYQELHDLIRTFEGIMNFSDAEFSWWKTLSEQHINNKNNDSLYTLVKMSQFFNAELKKIDPDIELPFACGLNKVHHMGITLERALCILSNSINPAEQIKTLHELDLGIEGAAYYFMSNDFARANREMELYPVSQKKAEKKEFPKTLRLYADPTKRIISPRRNDVSLFLYSSDDCPLIGTTVVEGETLPVYKINFLAFGGHGDFIAAVKHDIIREIEFNQKIQDGQKTRIVKGVGYEKYDKIIYGETWYDYDTPEGRKSSSSAPPKDGTPYTVKHSVSETFGMSFGYRPLTVPQPLEDSQQDEVLISSYELRSRLTPETLLQICAQAKTTFCVKLFIQRYLGQQPWIAGDDSLDYYREQMTAIENHPKFTAEQKRWLMVFTAYLSSGKRGAMLDQRKALDQMLFSLTQESRDEVYQNKKLFRFIDAVIKYDPTAAVRPTILEAHALYKLLCPSEEVYDELPPDSKTILTRAFGILNQTQHQKESIIANLSNNHNATFAQFFKIYLTIQSCQSRTEVIGKIGENKSSELFSQSYVIKRLTKLYNEHKEAERDAELLKKIHAVILNDHLNLIEKYPRLARIIALLNPISLDEEGIQKLDAAFSKNETTKKLFELFSTATYRSKYSNFTTLDTLLNYVTQKPETTQTREDLAEEARVLFPDLRFVGAKLDINEELIRALDDLCGNLEDILSYNEIKDAITPSEQTAIKLMIKNIKETTQPEEKIKLYGPLVDAILNLQVLTSKPVQKALVIAAINNFMLPNVRAALIEPLLSTVAKLGLSEKNSQSINAYIEKTVPVLTINTALSNVGDKLIHDLDQISRAIRTINAVLQELSFNKSMLSRARMGLLSEQYLQHVHTSDVQTICALIRLCGRAKTISVGGVFHKLTTHAIGVDEQKNAHIQNATNAIIVALEPPLPTRVIESLLLFTFQCANFETAEIISGIIDLYRNQLEQNQFEEFEQALHYAQTFSHAMADTVVIITELKALDMAASAKEIFNKAKIKPNIILAALKLAKQSTSQDAKTALDILLKSMSVDSTGVSESKIRDVFERLIVLLQNSQLATDIQSLYQKRPYFSFELLHKNIFQYNPQDLGTECRQYDKNPNLKRIIKNSYTQLSETHQQFNVLRVNTVINDLYDIKKNIAISEEHANTLKQAFNYVNDIGYQKAPHSGMVSQPIKELNRADLLAYFAKLRAGLASNVDDKTKTLYNLELLAVLREVMYRTTGTAFPYSTQIINVINDVIYHQGNVSSQIRTGEGKTIISTLKAVMLWAEPGHTVDVCTANLELAAQSRREYQNFYDYLEIPTAVIDKDSPDRTYRFNGINFSDVSNFRLYQSRVKFAPDSEWAEMMKQKNKPIIDLVLDENDVPILDEYRTAYNFSVQLSDQSLSDVNPNAALYPIINEFIKTAKFIDPKATRKNDVENCRDFFITKNIPLNVSEAQIDIWLDAAVIASRLRENKDFVVTKTTVTINKKEMLVHEAQIIINDRPQPGAKWTDGVHQFLHARLQQENRKEEPFIIEPELSIVDTASSKTFILEHLNTGGRLLGMTGTLGSAAEIKSYEDYDLSLYRVPSHKVNRLVKLPALAAAHEAGLYDQFFGKDFINQLKQQILESKKNRGNQPILIIAPDIETVNKYNKLLEAFLKENHFNLQTVTGTQATPEEECVRRAGEPGMVTIATPMFGRGTDIKPVRKKGSSDPHPYGLFTICTFLPDLRTEEQIYGRPARNGQLGQYLRLYDPSNNNLVNLEGMNAEERESAIAQARLSRENHAQLKRLYAQATSECMQEFLEKFDQELLSINVLDTKKLHAFQTRRYLFITHIQTQSEALIDQIYEKGIDPFNPYFDQNQRPVTTHLDLAQQQLHDFAKELYQDLLDQSLSSTESTSAASTSASPKRISRLRDCVLDITSANIHIKTNEQNEMHAFMDSFVSYYDQYRSVQIEKYKNDLGAAEHIEEICKLADDVNRISYEFSHRNWDNKKIGVEVATVIELLLLKTDKSYYRDVSTQFFQGFIEALNRLSHVTQNECVEYCWRTLLLKDHVRAKWLPYLSDTVKQDFYTLCSETVRKNYQADFTAYIDANKSNPEKSKNVRIAEHYQTLLSSYPIHQIDFSDEKMPGYQPSSSSGIFYSSSGTTSLTDPMLRELIESARAFKADIGTAAQKPYVPATKPVKK